MSKPTPRPTANVFTPHFMQWWVAWIGMQKFPTKFCNVWILDQGDQNFMKIEIQLWITISSFKFLKYAYWTSNFVHCKFCIYKNFIQIFSPFGKIFLSDRPSLDLVMRAEARWPNFQQYKQTSVKGYDESSMNF